MATLWYFLQYCNILKISSKRGFVDVLCVVSQMTQLCSTSWATDWHLRLALRNSFSSILPSLPCISLTSPRWEEMRHEEEMQVTEMRKHVIIMKSTCTVRVLKRLPRLKKNDMFLFLFGPLNHSRQDLTGLWGHSDCGAFTWFFCSCFWWLRASSLSFSTRSCLACSSIRWWLDTDST